MILEKRIPLSYWLNIILCAIWLLPIACNAPIETATKGEALKWMSPQVKIRKPTSKMVEGETLANTYCSTCHAYVPPDMLDRITWPRVLTFMKQQMDKKGQLINQDDWITIQQFYLSNAPKVFSSTPKEVVPTLQTQFEEFTIASPENISTTITLLKYLKADSTLYVGEKNGLISSFIQNTLQPKWTISNIPIDVQKQNESLFVLGIGSLAPSEKKKGQLLEILLDASQNIVIDHLHRPVQFQLTDLETSEQPKFLIASFGTIEETTSSGEVAIYDKEAKKIEIATTGVLQVHKIDIDKDGKEEIVCLFSQDNERIDIFKTSDDSTFLLYKSIPFSPVFGTNSFQIIDMNGDGFLDLIVTNGDNDDYSQIFKPYHGIRIFLNDGASNFNLTFFYQINGASKVKAADLDRDGDIDFVVLAMYPDLFSRPWESVLYFENKGDLSYKVQAFEGTPAAKWLLLELADIDDDKDLDIVLAANEEITGLTPPQLRQRWRKEPIQLKIFHNTLN